MEQSCSWSSGTLGTTPTSATEPVSATLTSATLPVSSATPRHVGEKQCSIYHNTSVRVGLGIFCVDPWFCTISVVPNLGWTQEIIVPTRAYYIFHVNPRFCTTPVVWSLEIVQEVWWGFFLCNPGFHNDIKYSETCDERPSTRDRPVMGDCILYASCSIWKSQIPYSAE